MGVFIIICTPSHGAFRGGIRILWFQMYLLVNNNKLSLSMISCQGHKVLVFRVGRRGLFSWVNHDSSIQKENKNESHRTLSSFLWGERRLKPCVHYAFSSLSHPFFFCFFWQFHSPLVLFKSQSVNQVHFKLLFSGKVKPVFTRAALPQKTTMKPRLKPSMDNSRDGSGTRHPANIYRISVKNCIAQASK